MAATLTDSQIEEFKEAFTLYDRNMDGTITSKDLGNVLKAIGQNPSDEETRNLVERVSPFRIFGVFKNLWHSMWTFKSYPNTYILREFNIGKIRDFLNALDLGRLQP